MLLLTLCLFVPVDDLAQQPTPENLRAHCQQLYSALHVKGDTAQAAKLFKQFMPSEERLKKGLRSDVKPEHLKAINEFREKMQAVGEKEISGLMKKGQSEVQVHGATTEEILAYQKDSIAYKEFPGGTQRLAQLILQPKMTYYEVEFLEPGKDAGMKYHLFYWDGKQWAMLGPLWRAIR